MSCFPHCAARRLLSDTPAGPRVFIASLHHRLTRAELIAFDRSTMRIRADEHGVIPADIEAFLENLDIAAAGDSHNPHGQDAGPAAATD